MQIKYKQQKEEVRCYLEFREFYKQNRIHCKISSIKYILLLKNIIVIRRRINKNTLSVPKTGEEKQISLKISEKSHDEFSEDSLTETQKLTSIASEEDFDSSSQKTSVLISQQSSQQISVKPDQVSPKHPPQTITITYQKQSVSPLPVQPKSALISQSKDSNIQKNMD